MVTEEQIEKVVDLILEDYRQQREIDKMEILTHPDRDVIQDVMAKLLCIVFPRDAKDKNYRIYNRRHNLSMLIEDVMFNLSRQIGLALRCAGEEKTQDLGEQLCLKFLEKIPGVRALVQADLEAAFDGDPAATGYDEIILSYPGVYAISVYRLAHELYLLEVPLIPRMMTEYAHNVTGIDIHPGAAIGTHFFIDHGTGIVIGQTTVIGNFVKLYQGVTLGGLSTRGGQRLRGTKRHPTLEDRVTVYAGASILGGNTVIGRDCVIGANAFVTSSVAPCTTVTVKNQELQLRSRDDCPFCE